MRLKFLGPRFPAVNGGASGKTTLVFTRLTPLTWRVWGDVLPESLSSVFLGLETAPIRSRRDCLRVDNDSVAQSRSPGAWASGRRASYPSARFWKVAAWRRWRGWTYRWHAPTWFCHHRRGQKYGSQWAKISLSQDWHKHKWQCQCP